MLGVKDKGILLQIVKRCNRVVEKVSNISETDFSLMMILKKLYVLIYFK